MSGLIGEESAAGLTGDLIIVSSVARGTEVLVGMPLTAVGPSDLDAGTGANWRRRSEGARTRE
jgi:hypothetical protein